MREMLVLQGALPEETDVLAAALEDAESLEVEGFSFRRGRLGRYDVAVSRTGVGPIDAAAATALAIHRFHPRLVLNQGTAGAHREELHRGDIVLGESCVPIHGLFTRTRGRGEGTGPLEWELREITGEESRPVEPYLGDEEWLRRLEDETWTEGRLLRGRLGSGEVFNREYDRIAWLRQRLGEDCEDMESFAVYRTCRRLGTACLGVRIISNNELTGEGYQRSFGQALQRFVLAALGKER